MDGPARNGITRGLGGDSQLAQKIQATMLERKEEYALKPVPKMPGGDGSDRRH